MEVQWISEFGEDGGYNHNATDIEIFESSLYVSGYYASSSGTQNVSFISQFDLNGAQKWINKIDSRGHDWIADIAIDSAENVYFVGSTTSSLEGGVEGDIPGDLFYGFIESTGELVEIHQVSDIENYMQTMGIGIAVNDDADVFVAGYSNGVLEDIDLGYDRSLNEYEYYGFLLKTKFNGESLPLKKVDLRWSKIWSTQF